MAMWRTAGSWTRARISWLVIVQVTGTKMSNCEDTRLLELDGKG